jgi:beta-glucosidase
MSCNTSSTESGPTDATPRSNSWWQERHQDILNTDKSDVKLLFLGDSITQQWETPEYGLPIWEQYYKEGYAFNMGFSGDKTQHLLWRIRNGELDGMSPEVTILMIGTNNTEDKDTPEDIALGINLIIDEVQLKLPNTKLVVHRIFSRGSVDSPVRLITNAASLIISERANDDSIIYVDINERFEDGLGNIPKNIMYDGLHLTTQGYQIWADAIVEYIAK